MPPVDDVLKQRATSTDFSEVGSTGLVQFGGQVKEDFLRQLQGNQGHARYREMADNHPVIGGILTAIDQMVRSTDWTVEPSFADDQRAVDEADFVAGCMNDMSHTWQDTVASVLSMLVYGFSYHEIVYKRRAGHKDDGESSKHDDQRIGWRKLPIRAQDTVWKWEIDGNGGIEGMWQMDPYAVDGSKAYVFIPIEKALLFRTTTKMNNPRGRSALRNAYVPWYYQRRIAEIEAVGIERDLAGLPVALVPPQLLSDNATSAETAALTEIKRIVRNIRRDEQEGLVFPLAYDPDTGNLAYDLKLLTTGGRRQFDTSAIITRYDARIAMSLLADFIMLGHDKVGTQALSVSKIELFLDSVKAWLAAIADVFNAYAIPRLMRLNGVDETLHPHLRFSAPANIDLGVLGDYVSKLTAAGALMPDENMGEYLRSIAGLPAEEAEAVE